MFWLVDKSRGIRLAGVFACQCLFWDLPSWTEFEGCPVLKVPTLPALSQYSSSVLCQQPIQRPFWSTIVFEIHVLPIFQFVGLCSDGTVGFTCHGDCICCNRQGVLEPPATRSGELVGLTGVSGTLDRSSFGSVCYFFVVATSRKVD